GPRGASCAPRVRRGGNRGRRAREPPGRGGARGSHGAHRRSQRSRNAERRPTHHRHARRQARTRGRVATRRAAGRHEGQGAGRVGGTGCDRAHRAGLAGRGARFGRGDPGAHMRLDAVGLEVMAHAFASIAEEMGLVLVHSALSPNIRERRDASAALFDADGEMIAQAAHIPVHLGALADAVAAVRSLEPQPGDLFILNDPYSGGSHLPGRTLIGAIDIDGQVGGYSVVRAHHSDVGGMTPGSMPASARELYQEGIIIPPTRLTPEVQRVLLANVRTPAMRRGDLAAQRAAVERGAQGLRALARRHGWGPLREAARELLDYAERRTTSAINRLSSAIPMTATDYLEGDGVIDDDVEIRVSIAIEDGIFHADFTGTRDAAPGNVNCPIAVTRSAVLFVVRTLLPDDVPMNGGVSRAIAVTAPPGCLVNARPPSAVAAGNVETSQRIADTVFRALAAGGCVVPAQGQGTMNNVTFGGPSWTYYETIGGGQGASRGANGPSGVHVGMSNTRNTPIEV